MAFRFGIRRRWLRISTRTFLLLVLVLCAWFAYLSNRARRQEELVRRLVTEGRGLVSYHHEWDAAGQHISHAPMPGPGWLRELVGDHALLRLRGVATYKVNDDDLRLIAQFPGIETLSLDESVRDEHMKYVASLRNLKELHLGSPHLTDETLKHISGLHKLEELLIPHAEITDAGLRHLENLTNLKMLYIDQTQVTAEGAKWLRKHLPQVTLEPPTFASAPKERDVVQQLIKNGARFSADQEGFITDVMFCGKNIGDEQLLPLASLARLTGLSFLDTSVTFAGIDRLLQTHPKLKLLPRFPRPLAEEAEAVAALNRVGAGLHFDQQGHVTAIESFNEDLDPASLASLADLHELKRVMLFSSDVGTTGCDHLAKVIGLEDLSMHYAELEDANFEQLKSLASLKELEATAPDMSDDGLAHLGGLPSLEKLILGRVAIRGPGLAHLKNISGLSLRFQPSAEFSDDGLAYVAELPQLSMLSLQFTEITDDGLLHLAQLKNLEKLYLSNSNITDVGLLQLADLPKLTLLQVKETRVTGEGVQRFKEQRPECKVAY